MSWIFARHRMWRRQLIVWGQVNGPLSQGNACQSAMLRTLSRGSALRAFLWLVYRFWKDTDNAVAAFSEIPSNSSRMHHWWDTQYRESVMSRRTLIRLGAKIAYFLSNYRLKTPFKLSTQLVVAEKTIISAYRIPVFAAFFTLLFSKTALLARRRFCVAFRHDGVWQKWRRPILFRRNVNIYNH